MVPSAKRFNADVAGAQGFLSMLQELEAIGGGNCPELAMQGILNAIELVDWFSAIFVFTDAPALDRHRTEEVIDAAQSKRTTINFFDKQDCGSYPEHAAYLAIANALDGHVVHSISKETSLVDMVRILTTSTSLDIGGVALIDPSPVAKRSVKAITGGTIPIDTTVAEMKIVASTFSMDAISMTVDGPFVNSSANTSISRSFGTFHLKNPPPGNYHLSVKPADSKYIVYLQSTLYFEYSFWTEHEANIYLVDVPTKGKPCSMRVFHCYLC